MNIPQLVYVITLIHHWSYHCNYIADDIVWINS